MEVWKFSRVDRVEFGGLEETVDGETEQGGRASAVWRISMSVAYHPYGVILCLPTCANG